MSQGFDPPILGEDTTTFVLPGENVSEEHHLTGALLEAHWNDLSPDQLQQIAELVIRDVADDTEDDDTEDESSLDR